MKAGDTCYIVLNNVRIKEVVITCVSGNMYTVRFLDKKAAIRVQKSRVYETEVEALKSIPDENKFRFNRPDLH